MTQLCLVSISLGDKELILSEFITFTHIISLTECVWAKHGPRFGQSMDIRRVLSSLMVLSEAITINIQMLITHLKTVISLSYTHICVQHLKDYNFGQKNFA